MDNLSASKTATIRWWAAKRNVEPTVVVSTEPGAVHYQSSMGERLVRLPRWLDPGEQQNWLVFAYTLVRLPAALDVQMQRGAGISHFEYLMLARLSMAPARRRAYCHVL